MNAGQYLQLFATLEDRLQLTEEEWARLLQLDGLDPESAKAGQLVGELLPVARRIFAAMLDIAILRGEAKVYEGPSGSKTVHWNLAASAEKRTE
jgi:hypothetical protein